MDGQLVLDAVLGWQSESQCCEPKGVCSTSNGSCWWRWWQKDQGSEESHMFVYGMNR